MNEKTLSFADLLLLCVVLIWGTNYTVGKIALREFDPTSFAALRTILAAPFLFLALGLKERGVHLTKKDIPPFVLLGLFGNVLNRFAWSYGLHFTTASNASLLMSTAPILAALFASLFRIERVTLKSALGIGVAFLGVFFVIKGDFSDLGLGKTTLMGDFLMLGAALSWALFSIFAKPFLRDYSILKLTAWSAQFGAVFLVPFILGPLAQGAFAHPTLKGWLCLLYISILGNAVAHVFWVTGISKIGPTRTTMYQTFVPVVAIFFAVMFLGESLLGVQIVGVVLVIGGVYVIRFA
jgi:drug/metabolite transporter (DMT)-like permease